MSVSCGVRHVISRGDLRQAGRLAVAEPLSCGRAELLPAHAVAGT
jgi:hypothetical protein